jgi:multidrug resistance efflux pump
MSLETPLNVPTPKPSPTPGQSSVPIAGQGNPHNPPLTHNPHQTASNSGPSFAPTSSRLPRAKPLSKRGMVATVGSAGVLGVGLIIVLTMWWTGSLFGRAAFTGETFTVRKEKLKVSIVARGSLESARNGDIVCNVRSGNKGSTNSTTIKWLVDNGVEVKKGEQVMELDASGLDEQRKSQKIVVDQMESNWVTAKGDYKNQESTNESDVEAAKNALELARIDLEKYVKGDYPQALNDVEGRIEMAKSDLSDWQERANWSMRMYKKSLMSKVQADADANRVDASKIALNKVELEKKVLVTFTKPRTEQDLGAKLAEANRSLVRTTDQAQTKLEQRAASRSASKSIFDQEARRLEEIEGEIKKCKIVAPQDGLVVYFVPEQVKGGGGTQQSIVAQGEPVREGQKMMQIPDLSTMLVNVRVPEAQVSYLHNEPDSRDKSTWQKAQVRVDAFSSRTLNGHIKMVDNFASQQDFFAADVKVYKTIVTIDQNIDGLNLKPGMSAEVTIYADESATPVLVVPVQAVVGSISMGAKRKCYVLSSSGQPEMRDIVVGMCNERMVEVKTGLQEGDRVVQNPQKLMAEDSELKPGKLRIKNESETDSPGDEKKGDKKAKKQGPAGAPQAPAGKEFGGPPGGQEQMQALFEKMQNSTPEQRRDLINSNFPEGVRDRVREGLVQKGLSVAN